MEEIILHGKKFEYDPTAEYGIVVGFHRHETRYVPFNFKSLEAVASNASKITTKHNLRVYSRTIDYILQKAEEAKLPDRLELTLEQIASLERTSRLMRRIYKTLDSFYSGLRED